MTRGTYATDYTPADQMIISGARRIGDGDVIYVGTGLPALATYLAKQTHAPGCVIVHEVGTMRTSPCELDPSVDSLMAQTMADCLSGVFYVNALAQRGCFNLGFLGAGQIDRFGNVNDTLVGTYEKPVHRWGGGGGANDVMSFCGRTIIILRQSKRRFPERVDYVTCPGYLDGAPGAREARGLPPGTGPGMVITDLGIYGFEGGEMVLQSIHSHAGVTLERVRAEVGWDLKVSPDLQATEPPTEEELATLHEKVDPAGLFAEGKRTFTRSIRASHQQRE